MVNSEMLDYATIFPLFRNLHEKIKKKEEELNRLTVLEDHPLQKEFECVKSLNGELISQITILQAYMKSIIEDQIFKTAEKLAHPSTVQEIGVHFLKSMDIFRPSKNNAIISFIDGSYWFQLFQYIKKLPKFIPVFNNVTQFYKELQDKKIEQELAKVPIDIDDIIKEKYRLSYYSSPISFKDFLELDKSPVQNFTDNGFTSEKNSQSTSKLRDEFEKALEHKKTEEMKQKQIQGFDEYHEYLEMSERELERIKRKKDSKRKYSKKSRRRKYS